MRGGAAPAYVIKQRMDFKARKYTNDACTMTSVSRTPSGGDIEDLGHCLAGL